jgi:predicted dinucleotide-binding enzyme
MRIGIIGAGMIGETLARRIGQLGHQVAIANSRGPETLRDLASEVGATAVTALEAARSGEIVVITIPERSVADLPRDLFTGVPADVVVIDTGNYYPTRDGRIPAIEQGQPESAWVAEQIGRPVIKAFNNIYFKSLLENGRRRARPTALRFRSLAIRSKRAQRYCGWWTSSASIRSMPAGSRNRGVSSRARRATPRTSIPCS